jgi:hypothetical protein
MVVGIASLRIFSTPIDKVATEHGLDLNDNKPAVDVSGTAAEKNLPVIFDEGIPMPLRRHNGAKSALLRGCNSAFRHLRLRGAREKARGALYNESSGNMMP